MKGRSAFGTVTEPSAF